MKMKDYEVEVVIKNKPLVKDPEGETILRDLAHRGGYSASVVKSVRAGKLLTLVVSSESREGAEKITNDMCNDLRIYNPVIHTLDIRVKE
jgi:phosphoribosylformylglycinamidine synthase